MSRRVNGTIRPEGPLHWDDVIGHDFGYSLKTSFGQMSDDLGGLPLSFFLQPLQEVIGAGIEDQTVSRQ